MANPVFPFSREIDGEATDHRSAVPVVLTIASEAGFL
jgi:hypothetical protein